jgi:hypothetical protein
MLFYFFLFYSIRLFYSILFYSTISCYVLLFLNLFIVTVNGKRSVLGVLNCRAFYTKFLPDWRRPLGGTKRRWEDSIKTYLIEIV